MAALSDKVAYVLEDVQWLPSFDPTLWLRGAQMSRASWRALTLIAVVLLLPFGQAGRSGGGFGGRASVSSRITRMPRPRLSPTRPTVTRSRITPRVWVRSASSVTQRVPSPPMIWVQTHAPVRRSAPPWLTLALVTLVLLGVLA